MSQGWEVGKIDSNGLSGSPLPILKHPGASVHACRSACYDNYASERIAMGRQIHGMGGISQQWNREAVGDHIRHSSHVISNRPDSKLLEYCYTQVDQYTTPSIHKRKYTHLPPISPTNTSTLYTSTPRSYPLPFSLLFLNSPSLHAATSASALLGSFFLVNKNP